MNEEARRAQAATASFLTSVNDMLKVGMFRAHKQPCRCYVLTTSMPLPADTLSSTTRSPLAYSPHHTLVRPLDATLHLMTACVP